MRIVRTVKDITREVEFFPPKWKVELEKKQKEKEKKDDNKKTSV